MKLTKAQTNRILVALRANAADLREQEQAERRAFEQGTGSGPCSFAPGVESFREGAERCARLGKEINEIVALIEARGLSFTKGGGS